MAVTVSRAPIRAGLWWSEEGGGLATPRISERHEPRVPRSLTACPLRVCSGPLRAGRGSPQVTRPSRCAQRTDPAWLPPPRPLTLGRVPPHLTLPRRGSPAEPAAPRPPEQRRAGEGQAPFAHAHWSPRASRPAARARRGERGQELRTPQAPGVGRQQKGPRLRPSLPSVGARAAAAPRTAPGGAGPGRPSLAHAHLAGPLSGWRVRSDTDRRRRGGGRGDPTPPACLSGLRGGEQQRRQVHGEGEAAALPAHVRGQRGRAGRVFEAGAELEGQGRAH